MTYNRINEIIEKYICKNDLNVEITTYSEEIFYIIDGLYYDHEKLIKFFNKHNIE